MGVDYFIPNMSSVQQDDSKCFSFSNNINVVSQALLITCCRLTNLHVTADPVPLRPHLMHCILAVSHFSNRQDVYDAMRGIYNSVRPLPGCTLAPTFEEFTGMHQLCNHVFCRYMSIVYFQDKTTVKGMTLNGHRVSVVVEGLVRMAVQSSAGTKE